MLIEERDKAIKVTATQDRHEVYCYTDGSGRNGMLGTGIVYILLDENRTILEQYAITGLGANGNIYTIELKGTSTTLSQLAVWTMIPLEGIVTIFSDN